MPAGEVWHYLTDTRIEDQVDNMNEDAEWKSRNGKLTVLWFGKFNHADLFNAQGVQRGIAKIVRRQNIDDNDFVDAV